MELTVFVALGLASSVGGFALLLKDRKAFYASCGHSPALTNGDVLMCAILGGIPFAGLGAGLIVTLVRQDFSGTWLDRENTFFSSKGKED